MDLFDYKKLLKGKSINRVSQSIIPETESFEKGKHDQLNSSLTGFKPDGNVDLPNESPEEQYASKVSEMIQKGETLLGESTTLKILKRLSNDLENKLEGK
ncbi:MAG TPA: hypothetical protein VMX17_00630 [Candidatus Glassbacteria bacterium]|nr:hypothetical protein [Candidatus Glassbacteria bacterium]